VRVLIVDDHPSFRASVRVLLEAEGYEVVGEAADGAEALTAAQELQPDLVLLDVCLPDLDGFEVAERLAELPVAPEVILTSSRDGTDYGNSVAASSARGFVPKAELSGTILTSLLT
jgi:DNA-binding NarL/FixJ family response regulator